MQAVVVPFREFCTVSSLPFFTEFVGRIPFRLPFTNSALSGFSRQQESSED